MRGAKGKKRVPSFPFIHSCSRYFVLKMSMFAYQNERSFCSIQEYTVKLLIDEAYFLNTCRSMLEAMVTVFHKASNILGEAMYSLQEN